MKGLRLAALAAAMASGLALGPNRGRIAGGHAAPALVPAAGGQPDEAFRDPVGAEDREGFQRAHQGPGLPVDAARRQGRTDAHAGARRRGRRRLDAARIHARRDAQARDLRTAVPASQHQCDRAVAAGIRPEIHEEGFRAVPRPAGALSCRRAVHDQGPDQQDRGLPGHEAALVLAHQRLDPRGAGRGAAAGGAAGARADAQQGHGQWLDPALRDRACGQDAGPHRLLHHAGAAAAAAVHGDLHLPDEQGRSTRACRPI